MEEVRFFGGRLGTGMTCVASNVQARSRTGRGAARYTASMARKASVVIEKDDFGFYAWCPELKGCQSQGDTLEEAIANIKEAIELYIETLSPEECQGLLSREILTTAVEVNV